MTTAVQITLPLDGHDLRLRRFLGGTARPFGGDYGLTNRLRAQLILNSLPSPPWEFVWQLERGANGIEIWLSI